MKISESKTQALFKNYLLDRVARRGMVVPSLVLGVVLLFTLTDYLVLGLDSIFLRLLAIIPLIISILGYMVQLEAKILMRLQQSWLLGGNLMMAGLCFVVFSQFQDDSALRYGTILGYSIAIYISILISYDHSILWIIILPLVLTSLSLYLFIEMREWILMLNLYMVVGVSFVLVNNQHQQEYQLFKQRLLTEDLNLRLEQFSHIASHDLMSPLGSISANIGIIQKRLADHEYEKALKLFPGVLNSVKQMADLLEGILAYSKEPNVDEVHDWVNLQDLISQIQVNLSEHINSNEVNIVVGRQMPVIFGSRTRMYQICYNLIFNAIKYKHTHRGLDLLVESFSEGKEYLIAFHDNGRGIPPFMHQRVFDPFERYHIDLPGSGLGLSMVKKHVELHGGRIELSSAEGQGSSFFLYFPSEICRIERVLS